MITASGIEEKPSLDDIEHYGIKGMKWGVRRSDAQLARARGKVTGAAKKVKALSDERDQRIRKAREDRPKAKQNYKKAKKVYKVQKHEIGRKEAKKALKPVRDEFYNTANIAKQSTAGEIAVGLIVDSIFKVPASDIQRAARNTQMRIDVNARSQARKRYAQSQRINKDREEARAKKANA